MDLSAILQAEPGAENGRLWADAMVLANKLARIVYGDVYEERMKLIREAIVKNASVEGLCPLEFVRRVLIQQNAKEDLTFCDVMAPLAACYDLMVAGIKEPSKV